MHVPNVHALFKAPNGVAPKPNIAGRPLFSFKIPDPNDPSIILGNRYLNQGDGAVLSSTSGMGKSAMAIQMCTMWSLAMAPFGIKPSRALRILLIQSEDSDGDVAEVTASIAHVLQLTSEQIDQVNKNVLVVSDRVNRGTRFLAQLKAHIASHKPDLVVINPLQAFVDGDITASKDLGAFLREGLNSLNEPAAFAYLLIHHTTKPATGKERAERQWHEVMYDMAGGAEIINWARAIMSLRATPTEGEFNLVLAKRGRRAGVTKRTPQGVGYILEPVSMIALQHAKGHLPCGLPIIFWETRETPDADSGQTKARGRDEKYKFDDYCNLFPAASSEGLPLAQLHRALMDNGEISRKQIHQVCVRWAEQGNVEIIDEAGKPRRYRKAL